MDWEYLDRELRKVYHKKTISVYDKETLQSLLKIIIKRYPYMRRERLRKAIEIIFQSMYEPYLLEEFLERLTQKMTEASYSVLIGKKKKWKISYKFDLKDTCGFEDR